MGDLEEEAVMRVRDAAPRTREAMIAIELQRNG